MAGMAVGDYQPCGVVFGVARGTIVPGAYSQIRVGSEIYFTVSATDLLRHLAENQARAFLTVFNAMTVGGPVELGACFIAIEVRRWATTALLRLAVEQRTRQGAGIWVMRREEPSPAPGMPLASGQWGAELRPTVMRMDRRSPVPGR